jgi:hypothetical protein
MKKTYYVLPSCDIWSSQGIVSHIRKAFETRDEAIHVAKCLSREYDADFLVYALEAKVSTISKIIDTV